MAESDGIDEAAEQMLRVALTAAAQLAERLAHARAQAAREAQARSDRDAREQIARVEAEHRAARAQLTLTRDPRWWDTATGPDIADAYATARQWADLDPAAARDADRITQQVRERYGTTAVPAPSGRSPAVRLSPPVQRPAEQAAEAKAAAVLAADARANIAKRTQTWRIEHTDGLPPQLTQAGAVEAVDARFRADLAQPRSAIEATASWTSSESGTRARPRTVHRGDDIDLERT